MKLRKRLRKIKKNEIEGRKEVKQAGVSFYTAPITLQIVTSYMKLHSVVGQIKIILSYIPSQLNIIDTLISSIILEFKL